jgi:hypothetical protein
VAPGGWGGRHSLRAARPLMTLALHLIVIADPGLEMAGMIEKNIKV